MAPRRRPDISWLNRSDRSKTATLAEASADDAGSDVLQELRALVQGLTEDRRRGDENNALSLSLSRQLEAAHDLIDDLQQQLDALSADLYVARSDQQRSASLADDLRAQLHAQGDPTKAHAGR